MHKFAGRTSPEAPSVPAPGYDSRRATRRPCAARNGGAISQSQHHELDRAQARIARTPSTKLKILCFAHVLPGDHVLYNFFDHVFPPGKAAFCGEPELFSKLSSLVPPRESVEPSLQESSASGLFRVELSLHFFLEFFNVELAADRVLKERKRGTGRSASGGRTNVDNLFALPKRQSTFPRGQ